MNDTKIKVLYITGRGRSGSTVLDNILGQMDGVFNVGEMRLWNRRYADPDAVCGCGQRLQDCSVWSAIFKKAYGDLAPGRMQEVLALHERGARVRYLPLLFIPGGKWFLKKWHRAYLDNLQLLYAAIQSATGCRVIVDSSKSPLYGLLLGLVPSIELHVIHLVRDSRAVAYSWLRQKAAKTTGNDPLYKRRIGPAKSALMWNAANAAAAALEHTGQRYRRLRYEDLMRAPVESVNALLEHAQIQTTRMPFVGSHEVTMGASHTISGNPKRFNLGNIQLRPDEAWKHEMPPRDRRVVTLLSWPWLRRYGYLPSTR
jgi:Sulfotransferase family